MSVTIFFNDLLPDGFLNLTNSNKSLYRLDNFSSANFFFILILNITLFFTIFTCWNSTYLWYIFWKPGALFYYEIMVLSVINRRYSLPFAFSWMVGEVTSLSFLESFPLLPGTKQETTTGLNKLWWRCSEKLVIFRFMWTYNYSWKEGSLTFYLKWRIWYEISKYTTKNFLIIIHIYIHILTHTHTNILLIDKYASLFCGI